MILHDYLPSGNGHKIRLLCSYLGLSYEYREYDILKGETRTEDFLAFNPNGKIPVLELDNGHFLSESNAILLYLAETHSSDNSLIPKDAEERAGLYKWLFWEQYSHEPNIASVRFWLTHSGLTPLKEQMLPDRVAQGNAALAMMDEQLAAQTYMLGENISLVDFCLFAYTHVAEEGRAYQLSQYPNIQKWIQIIKSQPWYIPITQTP